MQISTSSRCISMSSLIYQSLSRNTRCIASPAHREESGDTSHVSVCVLGMYQILESHARNINEALGM